MDDSIGPWDCIDGADDSVIRAACEAAGIPFISAREDLDRLREAVEEADTFYEFWNAFQDAENQRRDADDFARWMARAADDQNWPRPLF